MKNFVKLIRQAHEEKFSAVLNKVLRKKIPVAFLSIHPIAQAVDEAKNFYNQGLNIANLVVTDNCPPPCQS